MPVRPNFINIGPGRCGTSWLHEVLAAHPQIGMGKVKETEFFNTNFGRGVDWYESHFADLASHIAIGEVSNNYYLDAEVATRIWDYRPDMKIIVNIRDPLSLLSSFYEFGERRGLTLPPLRDALDEPIGRFMGSGYDYRQRRNCLTTTDQVTLLDSVRLNTLMQPFLRAFPSDQIYFFVYDRFRQDPQLVRQEIYMFLGVDPRFEPDVGSSVVNQSIKPKHRVLANLGSRLAFLLRRIGAYGALSALHRSRLVKRLFFRPAHREGRRSEDIEKRLAADMVEDLKRERRRIDAMVPDFSQYMG